MAIVPDWRSGHGGQAAGALVRRISGVAGPACRRRSGPTGIWAGFGFGWPRSPAEIRPATHEPASPLPRRSRPSVTSNSRPARRGSRRGPKKGLSLFWGGGLDARAPGGNPTQTDGRWSRGRGARGPPPSLVVGPEGSPRRRRGCGNRSAGRADWGCGGEKGFACLFRQLGVT